MSSRLASVRGLALTASVAMGVTVFGQTPVRPNDPTWVAPAAAAGRVNPLRMRPDAAAGGARVFGERCVSCHGGAGAGTAKAPDLAVPAVQAQTDGALFWKISTGHAFAGMPPFSNLPEGQRWQLVLHLRTLIAP